MTITTHSWEHPLLTLAQEAWHAAENIPFSAVEQTGHQVQDPDLIAAYAWCESLTAANSRSFHMASRLLPLAKRQAVRALYAFCRVTDDLVDEAPTSTPQERAQAFEALMRWRNRALSDRSDSADPVVRAWQDARMRYGVPVRYAEQLVDGVAQDLTRRRYGAFAELATYCYGVASTVGLMSMHIIGFTGPQAIPYAVKLGVALQLTNILRDIQEDWEAGRVYLPQEELTAFGLTEEDIEAGVVTDAWRRFMAFQIARNRRLYTEAWTGIRMLAPDGRFSIAAAAELYRGILDDIEAHDYDVFTRRARLSTAGKLIRLPGIWWRSRR